MSDDGRRKREKKLNISVVSGEQVSDDGRRKREKKLDAVTAK